MVDIDGEQGQSSFESLCLTLSELPPTATATTGKGKHLWFKVRGEVRNSAGKLGTGIDVRGDGGYVILPPSPHPNGKRYKWESTREVARLPEDWEALLLSESPTVTQTEGYRPNDVAEQPIPTGQRDTSLCSLAGTMRARGMNWQAIDAALQIVNITRCRPPLPEGQVTKIARSNARYEPLEVKFTIPGVLGSEVKLKRIDWLWRGFLPIGRLVILEGDPGLGKSTVALDVCARITRGDRMPDGTDGTNGGAVYVSLEDGIEDTLAVRAAACGADLSRIRFISEIEDRTPTIPTDIPAIEAALESTKAKLLVLDPLVGMLAQGKTDYHRDQDVRRALAPLASMASRLGVCVLVIRHLNKVTGKVNAKYRGTGSIGLIGAARASFLVAPDPSGNGCILAPVKKNLAKSAYSLRFHITDAAVDTPIGAVESSRVEWDAPCGITADQLLAPSGGHS